MSRAGNAVVFARIARPNRLYLYLFIPRSSFADERRFFGSGAASINPQTENLMSTNIYYVLLYLWPTIYHRDDRHDGRYSIHTRLLRIYLHEFTRRVNTALLHALFLWSQPSLFLWDESVVVEELSDTRV
jgi:hypothetical protein